MIKRFKKKPIVLEAVQLTNSLQSIQEVQKFIQGGYLNNNSCRMAEDSWDEYVNKVIDQEGIFLKTPESDGQTQKISFGDYVFKGHSQELGDHYWPVKESYVLENYEEVLD